MSSSSPNPEPHNIVQDAAHEQVLQQITNQVARRKPDSVDRTLAAFSRVIKESDSAKTFDEEICRQLVEASLKQSAIDLPTVPSLRRKLVSSIADALMSDDTSRSRLEAFWQKQSGGAK